MKDIDRGLRGILIEFSKLSDTAVEVGLHQDAGSEGGTSLAQIAAWNEYGTKRIPPRPAFRIAADTNQGKWGNTAETLLRRVAMGRMGAGQVVDIIGNMAEGDVKAVFGDRSRLAPNAPATIRRKKSDAPLIDTGRLRASIKFRVKRGWKR